MTAVREPSRGAEPRRSASDDHDVDDRIHAG
jgi:hypothetical protein